MQIFKFLAVVAATLGFAAAAPTPGVEVELYNNHATLEERSHCYDKPSEKPECRQGCGWYSFSADHVDNNPLVHVPANDKLLCESFNGLMVQLSIGSSCHCDVWSANNCLGTSKYQFDGEGDHQNLEAKAYRCYLK